MSAPDPVALLKAAMESGQALELLPPADAALRSNLLRELGAIDPAVEPLLGLRLGLSPAA